MDPSFEIYNSYFLNDNVLSPINYENRKKKIKWKDENDGELEEVKFIETKYEPYFRIFMTNKNLIKSIHILNHLDKKLNIKNKENINHRLQVMYDHIRESNIYDNHFNDWIKLSKEFPEITDQFINYDTV